MDRSPEAEQLALAWLAGMKAGDAAAVARLFAEHEATTVIGNGADQWFTGDAYTGRRLRDSLGEQGGILAADERCGHPDAQLAVPTGDIVD